MNPQDYNRVAFVASGGGFKAMGWHIGVAMALKEYGIAMVNDDDPRADEFRMIDHIIGSSGGAIFGSVIANGMNEDEVEKLDKKSLLSYFLPLRNGKDMNITDFSYYDVFKPNLPSPGNVFDYGWSVLNLPRMVMKYGPGVGFESLLRQVLQFKGFFSLDRFEKFLSKVLPINDFHELHKKNGVDLNIVATEVNNPRKAIFGRHNSHWVGSEDDNFYRDRYVNTVPISKAVAASSSIVPIYKPTEIDGISYFDGEIKQSLSIHIATDQGADLVIVSHTFKPYIQDRSMGDLNDVFSLIMQEIYTAVYQKIQAPKTFNARLKKVYERIRSEDFRKKYNIEPDLHKQMVEEICDTLLFNPKRKYIFISSPNELFFMDHFNLLSYANREVMSSGYYRARQIMEWNGFKRLERYRKKGILDSRKLRSFRFPSTDYERYKSTAKRNIPTLDDEPQWETYQQGQ